jgi:Uma2 family endonuclease
MRLIADDVLSIPVPDHLRGYELEDGELVEVSLVSPPHGRIAAQIARHVANHVEDHGVAGHVYVEAGCVLGLARDPERLRGPDVSYVSEETLLARGGEPSRGWFRLVPDLVVEVDSPGRRPAVEQRRIQDYLDAGVELLWVVHTEAGSATAYRRDGTARLLRRGDNLNGDPVLPGLRIPLSKLFPGTAPPS